VNVSASLLIVEMISENNFRFHIGETESWLLVVCGIVLLNVRILCSFCCSI